MSSLPFKGRPLRGMSFIDVLVGSALTLIVFLALFGLIRASVIIASAAKAKAGATAIVTEQIEYIRSLPYDSIGTQGGIPPGSIPQNATTTQNGITYTVRTFIIYADDPADGVGGDDANGITADYKRVKVAASYTTQSGLREVALISNHSPIGVESTVGGGTLRLEVVDASGVPVPGATVRVVNTAITPNVDVTTFSDIDGTVLFSGAATSTEYQVYVSKAGYSSTQTYPRDSENQNPTPGYLTVDEGATTTWAFAIDHFATLMVHTLSPATFDSFLDSFDDITLIDTLTDTAVSGGEVALSGSPGFYLGSGSVESIDVVPTEISNWDMLSAILSVPANTTAVVQVVDVSGTLVPEMYLPGNAAGFSVFPVDLSGIATSTYPALALRSTLTSSDAMVTPSVAEWELSFEVEQTPLSDVPLTLSGEKTIGSTIDGAPIYKTIITTTTDAAGVRMLYLEWDLYSLLVGGYTIQTVTPASPYELLPGGSASVELILTP